MEAASPLRDRPVVLISGDWIVGADPVADLLATLQELAHLGVGFVSLTMEALDLDDTSRSWAWPRYWQYSRSSKREFCGNACAPAWPMLARTARKLGRPITAGSKAGQVAGSYTARGVSKAEIARLLQIGRTSVLRRILGVRPISRRNSVTTFLHSLAERTQIAEHEGVEIPGARRVSGDHEGLPLLTRIFCHAPERSPGS